MVEGQSKRVGDQQPASNLMSIEAPLRVDFHLQTSTATLCPCFFISIFFLGRRRWVRRRLQSEVGGRPRKDGPSRPASADKTAQNKPKRDPPSKTNSTRASTRLKGLPKRFEDGALDGDAMEVDEQVAEVIPNDDIEEPPSEPKPRVRPTPRAKTSTTMKVAMEGGAVVDRGGVMDLMVGAEVEEEEGGAEEEEEEETELTETR